MVSGRIKKQIPKTNKLIFPRIGSICVGLKKDADAQAVEDADAQKDADAQAVEDADAQKDADTEVKENA